MRIGAVFADYDGTIAPLGVPREESRIHGAVERELRKISLKVPFVIVTAKDFDFAYPRSSFAAGWACVSGLDIRLADGRTFQTKKLRDLQDVLEVARLGERLGAFTELKRGPSGELLGVGVDWSDSPSSEAVLVEKAKALSEAGHYVVHDRHSTFADFYAAPPNKGKALKLLKRVLVIKSGVMFIGDSPNDNSAFQEAEAAIGVNYGQPTAGLRCDYIVDQRRLAGFLRSVYDRGMDFTPSLAGVRKRGVG